MEHVSRNDQQDLLHLRVWISQLAADYEQSSRAENLRLTRAEKRKHRNALRSARNSCDGKAGGAGKERIRELIAVGVSRYQPVSGLPPGGLLPQQIAIDFTVSALWPLVVVPKLPKSYLDDLSQITSEPLARLVAHARIARTTGPGMSVQKFGQAIANSTFASGVLNLLNDLADPRRGGCALTAVSIANSGSMPPHRKSPKVIAAWIFSAAAAGVVGNRADDALTGAIDWLHQSSGDSAVPHGDGHHHSVSGGGSSAGHQRGDGAARFIEEFIHGLFR
jgi:hypothetical protein